MPEDAESQKIEPLAITLKSNEFASNSKNSA